jgi:hypothetical protein
MWFARWVFLLAGITGVVVVAPLFFMEDRIGVDHPPPINHPEWYYGFLSVTLAWQLMYMTIGWNPIRHRLVMLPAIVAKSSFVATILILYALERVASNMLPASAFDAVWVLLFIVAFFRTPRDTERPAAERAQQT